MEPDTQPIPPVAPTRRWPPRHPWYLAAAVAAVVAAIGIVFTAAARAPTNDPPPATHLYNWPGGVAPLGVTLSDMQAYVMTPRVIRTVERQAWSARYFWRANTIRFQIIQDRLVGVSGRYLNRSYLADIRQVVNYSLAQGLTVVINAQTEQSMGWAQNEPLPTDATIAFFKALIPYYGHNPRVVFDLFNEPRRADWPAWEYTFQRTIFALRRDGARNWLWAEPLRWGSSYAGMPQPLIDPLHLLAYSVHHPGCAWPWQCRATPEVWQAAFGYLADEGYPVVDGEFANYTGSYDWSYRELLYHADQRSLIQQYLRWLAARHIGMLAWSLVPGALNRNLSYSSVSVLPQGDGQLIKSWLARQNTAYTASPQARAILLAHRRAYVRWLRAHGYPAGSLGPLTRTTFCTPYPGAPARYHIKRCHHHG